MSEKEREKEKNLELERLVFFSDAIVAIAITLLALDVRLDKSIVINHQLTFANIWSMWPQFLSFFLSFMLIAVFWKVHHQFFFFIKRIDGTLLWFNIFWLLFIVILPFTTTLVSDYFGQRVSVLVYSINILLITIAQNNIWDYVARRPEYFLNEKADRILRKSYTMNCNLAMGNAIFAIALCFISPVAAFFVLFIRTVMISSFRNIFRGRRKRRNEAEEEKELLSFLLLQI